MDAEAVLARFKQDQVGDFKRVIRELDDPHNALNRQFSRLREIAERPPGNPFNQTALFNPGALEGMFLELHDHVMDHPVWRHPFFVRVFNGDFTKEQLTRFALQYFNQVKNTRQCVALALGRFSGVMEMPYGLLNERVSEMTQIVLAQLLADEYGVGSHSVEDYPSLGGLFESVTHIVMYRQIFEGLGVPFEEQDVSMLHGVADNVLIQRLVAGDENFTPLESLASVGLGMEWGVPEFFTLLLGGMVRFAWQNDVPLTREQLLVFVAHVQYDVLHAISVMLVTSFYSRDAEALTRIKGATNMLMSGRYGMMTAMYRHVFEEDCPSLKEIGLEPRYHITDRRIEQALLRARAGVADGRVVDAESYRRSTDMPFIFKG
jgi:pyrroloquinoline quinone (PQQ) biosynthesis protein C